jgi:hypothetical protein
MTKDEALEKSIHKWERIVADRRAFDNGSKNCQLCALYSRGACIGCPVRERTGRGYCKVTPYAIWDDHHHRHHDNSCIPYRRQKDCEECTRLAQAELDFLISLRSPEGAERTKEGECEPDDMQLTERREYRT